MKNRTTFVISQQGHRKLAEYCKARNIKMGEFIESAIAAAIDRELQRVQEINVSKLGDLIDDLAIIDGLHDDLHKVLNK